MQISVIIASNFHPEKFIILISLSNNILPKSKEKYNLKKNLVLFTKNVIFFTRFIFKMLISSILHQTLQRDRHSVKAEIVVFPFF